MPPERASHSMSQHQTRASPPPPRCPFSRRRAPPIDLHGAHVGEISWLTVNRHTRPGKRCRIISRPRCRSACHIIPVNRNPLARLNRYCRTIYRHHTARQDRRRRLADGEQLRTREIQQRLRSSRNSGAPFHNLGRSIDVRGGVLNVVRIDLQVIQRRSASVPPNEDATAVPPK